MPVVEKLTHPTPAGAAACSTRHIPTEPQPFGLKKAKVIFKDESEIVQNLKRLVFKC